MRSNTQINKKMWQRIEIISLFAKRAVSTLKLGLSGKQWLSSFVICLLLLPVFSTPTRAAYAVKINSDLNGFEPVNENLGFWDSTLRDLNVKIEKWTTPMREVNLLYIENEKEKKESDKDKKKEIKRKDNKDEGIKAEGSIKNDSTILESKNTKDKSIENAEVYKDKSNISTNKLIDEKKKINTIKNTNKTNKTVTTSLRFTNQLPVDEHESVYSAENNLGNPFGQVEVDSSNQAAIGRIRHRAGIANFSFGIPLASLSGREVDASIGMVYNSRAWNKSIVYPNGVATDHFTYDVEESWIAPGFSSGFGYLTSEYKSRNIVMMDGSNTYNTTYDEVIPRGITDSDGTRHGVSCASFSQILGGHNTAQKCDEYTTSDGSFIKISRNNNGVVGGTISHSGTQFTITHPNGSKVYYAGAFGNDTLKKHYPLIIQGSNGNRIRIAYKTDQSGRIDKITDTLNRKIKFYYENDSSGNPDKLVAITIPGMNTNEEIQTVRFYYEDITLSHQNKFVGEITAPSTVRVLKYVYTPATKTGYEYEYHSSFGMIQKITKRAGIEVSDATSLTQTGTVTNVGTWAATTEYAYPSGTPALTDVPKYTKRTDDWKGKTTSTASETLYDSPEPSLGQDRVSSITVEDSISGFDTITENKSFNTNDWKHGLIKETSIKKKYGPAGQYTQTMSKVVYHWESGPSPAIGRNNPILRKVEATDDAGETKTIRFEYDQYNNETVAEEYDFGEDETNSTPLRKTEITYETNSNWKNANLLKLPKQVKTIVNGVTVSKTEIEYDHNGNDSTIVRRNDIDTATHDTYYNPAHPASTETVCSDGNDPGQSALPNGCITITHPGYTQASAYRGNITKITKFSDATLTSDPNSDVTEMNYDIVGNLVEASMNCCQVTTIVYDKAHEYAFPITQTRGNSPTQLSTSVTYNRNTGLVLTTTNGNNQVTTLEYETDTLRRKKIIYPNGGSTSTEYSDKLISTPANLVPGFVKTKTTLELGKLTEGYAYFDGRGANIRNATETPDGWSVSEVEYDNHNRPYKNYNPFYVSTPNDNIPAGTQYTEATEYDGLSRTKILKLQDNSQLTIEASGKITTVTNQAGKKRRQTEDALGRVIRVDEPDPNGDLGTLTTPAQPTYYEYDGNNNLTKVTQSNGVVSQDRLFKYDSLSRLTHEKQVESNPTLDDNGIKGTPSPNKWTKVTKYNSDGKITEGTDARGVKTTFTYDGLNRLKTVAFSDGTPTVTNTYDQIRTGFFNEGSLTRIETADGGTARPDTPSTASEFDYDQMGRIVNHRQFIDNQNYELEYGYNLAGQIISQKYPSGKIVNFSYDANGRPSVISDSTRVFANDFQYLGNGGILSSYKFGNGNMQTFDFNDRLQMKQQNLTNDTEILQKYDYGYGEIDSNGNLDSTKNSGKLAQVESYIGTTKQWTQKYKFDSTDRLSEVKETRGDTNALSYKQNFDYDKFNNLYRKASSNPTTGQENPLPFTPIEATDIDKNTNRFSTDTSYDDTGNVVTDNKFRNMSYSYDANGRMYSASDSSNNQSNAVYDAKGQRVATKVNDIWNFYVYDILGMIAAEYGQTIATTDEGGVKYLFQDRQGSTRATLRASGLPESRIDYQAFGEEIGANTGLRTSSQGFDNSATLRQRFGLTEKDEATGLSHTLFRKLENKAGRWTSPDPYNKSGSVGNPQSWNKYVYVNNQPTDYVDPSGLLLSASGGYCIRYHYTNLTGTRSFWGPRTCYPGNDGGGGGGGVGSDTKVTKDDIEKAVKDCISALWSKQIQLQYLILSGKGKNGFALVETNDELKPHYGVTSLLGIRNDATSIDAQDIANFSYILRNGRNPSGPQPIGSMGITIAGSGNQGPLGYVSPHRNFTAANADAYPQFGNHPDLKKMVGEFVSSQIHELGNSLALLLGHSIGDPNNSKDTDSGYQLGKCVETELKKVVAERSK